MVIPVRTTAGFSNILADRLLVILKTKRHQTCFGDPRQFQISLAEAPKQVDTVIAHRVINRVHVLAGVSGGVRVDPWQAVGRKAIKIDTYGQIEADRITAQPADLPHDARWWD